MDISPDQLAQAVERLRQGGVAAFPTETVYGLGADALSPEAVARVYLLKGRPSRNPLIVHVSGEAMARRCTSAWPEEASRLARAFWPGPLSIVAPKSDSIPAIVTAGGPTVAVRCPDHPVALALIREFGGPIVGPSANPSGRVSPTTAAHVREAFSAHDVLVLDGGPCRLGIESTVVSVGKTVRVLRPGVIGAEAIIEVLRGNAVIAARSREGEFVESPGLLGTHYAPHARLVLFDEASWPDVVRRAVEITRTTAHAASKPAMVVLSLSARSSPSDAVVVAMPTEAAAYARRLYEAIRDADAMAPALIAVERPRTDEHDPTSRAIWEAVLDRLTRAAAGE